MINIYIGSLTEPEYFFDSSQIFSCSTNQNVALIGTELSVDTFTVVVKDKIDNIRDIRHFVSSDGKEIILTNTQIYAVDVGNQINVSGLIDLEYGTPVWYYSDNHLIGKFYIDKVKRTAVNRYEISCISAIGLLSKISYTGVMFNRHTFKNALELILDKDPFHPSLGTIIDYTVDDDVASLPVSGWIPYGTRRDAVYQLILANGVNIIKNGNGDPHFTFIHTAPETPKEVLPEKIFLGGNVDYDNPYSVVSVVEHSFTVVNTQDRVTLFDNTDGGSAAIATEVRFSNAPIIANSLQATQGLTIAERGVNYAIVTGVGVLTGIPYTHSKRTLTSAISAGASEKTAKVENCTLVNALNSQNLLNRLKAYFQPNGKIRTIRSSCIGALQPGQAYSIKTPFLEEDTAFLSSVNVRASSFDKAECVWRANYSPVGQASYYKHVHVIDTGDSGTWTVPDDVTAIKVVLIGGGSGGSSGWPGKNGKDADVHYIQPGADISGFWYGAEGGDGGDGGTGGSPGRMRIVELENLTPGTAFQWTMGKGGSGGAETGFIPDTESELKAALDNEYPGWEDTYPTMLQEDLALELLMTNWDGSPHAGNVGTPTRFGSYSTADNEAFVSASGYYDPITQQFFALPGSPGVRGGKGGARKVEKNGTFVWVTDGENVETPITDTEPGTVYKGGKTGAPFFDKSADFFMAYGGNGAGAAVGIDAGTNADWWYTDYNRNRRASGGDGTVNRGTRTVLAGLSGRYNDPWHTQTFSYLPDPVTTVKNHGCGGDGGHGGGGGAGSATVIVQRQDEYTPPYLHFHTRRHGYGCGGGRGGKGGDGCILIYY